MGDDIVENLLWNNEVGHDSPLDGAADRIIQTQILDFWIWSAERTGRILRAIDFSEFHVERIVDQQFIGDRLSDAEDFFDRFRRLENSHRAGQDAKHTGFLTIRDQPGRRRFGIETAIARIALMRLDRGQLTLKPKHAGGDQCFLGKETGVVHQKPRREVVGSVQHDIVLRDERRGCCLRRPTDGRC